MAVWRFPKHLLFDVTLSTGRLFTGCHFVEADEDTFTVDYDVMESFGRIVRTRGQFRLDMVTHIATKPPVDAALTAPSVQTAQGHGIP